MVWFKVDDGWAWHPKVRAAGKDGRGLWMSAGTLCAASITDGVVSPQIAKDAAFTAEVTLARAAPALVRVGLWHDARGLRNCAHECAVAAGKLTSNAWFFHDWFDYNPTEDVAKIPLSRLADRRSRRQKRDAELCMAIQLRDGPFCRYCAHEIDWRDRRGSFGATYDHVNPHVLDAPHFVEANALDNVVSACRQCNGRKGQHTPEEAGMVLLPPPLRVGGAYQPQPGRNLTPVRSEPGTDQIQTEPDQDLASRTRATPDTAGSGRTGTEPESNPGQIPARSDASTNPDGQQADVLQLPQEAL